jgi:hypothetical protein
VECKDPKWRPVCEEETAMCRREEGEPLDGRVQTIMFQVAVSFFNLVQKGFSRFF